MIVGISTSGVQRGKTGVAQYVFALLRALRGINLVGADVVEVSPPYDGPGQQTALAAANVAYDLLSLRALAQG